MTSAVFQAFKKATDGSGLCWDHVYDLTHKEARDEQRFPLGRLVGEDGRPYQWTYSLMPDHIPDYRKDAQGSGLRLPSLSDRIINDVVSRAR